MLGVSGASYVERTGYVMTASARRRSERVTLRTLTSLSAVLPGGKRICIDAHTVTVNAHGGLLEVGTDMAKGQLIRLHRPFADRIVTGRVLRIEGSDDGRFRIAFEFESPSPAFWPVSKPPADWSIGAFAA